MAPLIKYFIIVFTVCYFFSYNGCLADTFTDCTNEINDLFSGCRDCNSLHEETRVKGYLVHILSFIVIDNIKTQLYAYPFVQKIMSMRQTSKLDQTVTPNEYCNAIFPGDKSDCRTALSAVFKEDYGDRLKSIEIVFQKLSISYIVSYLGSYKGPLIAYINYVEGFVGVDRLTLGSGISVRSYCMIAGCDLTQISNHQTGYGQRLPSPSFSGELNLEMTDSSWLEAYGLNGESISSSGEKSKGWRGSSSSGAKSKGRRGSSWNKGFGTSRASSSHQPVAFYGIKPNTDAEMVDQSWPQDF